VRSALQHALKLQSFSGETGLKIISVIASTNLLMMRLSLWIIRSYFYAKKSTGREAKPKTSGDIRNELAIIPGTCLPHILKETNMSLLNVPAGKDLPEDIYVVIEIPANADPIKYEVDKDSGALFVDRFMSTAMFYPCNYGYINHTLSLDGDPVDVLVPTPYPLEPGSVIRCRPVGVLKMTDESGEDAKLVAVPHTKLSKEYDHIKDVNDLPELLKAQITHFFEHYKDLEKGKWVKVDGWDNAEAAKAEIVASFERAAKK
jgi:inorganic pyrophosphatase